MSLYSRDDRDRVLSNTGVQLNTNEKAKRMIRQLLQRRVASDRGVIRVSQAACFFAAALIPVLAFRSFAVWDLSAAQLSLGVLCTLSMALSYTALGILLECQAKAA